jgi:hypothetical protein
MTIDNLFKPEAIYDLGTEDINGIIEKQNAQEVKRILSSRFTASQVLEYIHLAQDTYKGYPDNSGNTIGELVKCWAHCTGQDLSDFEDRVYPKIEALVEIWQDRTGNLGLTNEEVLKWPTEAAEFGSAFLMVLLEGTPPSNLAESILGFLQAIKKSANYISDSSFRNQLEKACFYKARQIRDETQLALKDNAPVKAALISPEVSALVEYHLHKQGWGGDTSKATRLLKTHLQDDLRGYVKDKSIKLAITNALRLVSRRSLLRNLSDAVKGKLRAELVSRTREWFAKVKVQAESIWEYSTKPLLIEDTEEIRQWLFRR